MDSLQARWEEYRRCGFFCFERMKNRTNFDYTGQDQLKELIVEALSFWAFINENLSSDKFIDWHHRRDMFRQFFDHKNRFIRLIARIESMPTRLWRIVLWKYNIDFMSLESFLRRITEEQYDGVIDNHDDLYVTGILPRAYGFWDRKIRGLSTSDVLYDGYSNSERMLSKGSMSFNLLDLDFGFAAYPKGESDDTEEWGFNPKKFLTIKTHENDFIVNKESGLYWTFYRTARSNYVWFPKKKVELKKHICPGFYWTLFVHLMFWIVSPLVAITAASVHLSHLLSLNLWYLPLAPVALFTPLWCTVALAKSIIGKMLAVAVLGPIVLAIIGICKFVEIAFAVIVGAIACFCEWIYDLNSRWLDYASSLVLHLAGLISFPFVFTLYYNIFLDHRPKDYPEWPFYVSMLISCIVTAIIIICLHCSKRFRYRHMVAGFAAIVSPFIASILSVVFQALGMFVFGVIMIAFLVCMVAAQWIWAKIMLVGLHFAQYYINYLKGIGGLGAFFASLYALAKGLDFLCERAEKKHKMIHSDKKVGNMINFLNVFTGFFGLFSLSIIVLTIYNVFTSEMIAWSIVMPSYWTLVVGIASVAGVIFLVNIRKSIFEKRPVIKHLRDVIYQSFESYWYRKEINRWQTNVTNFEKNVAFMKLSKNKQISLIKEVNKFIRQHFGNSHEMVIADAVAMMSRYMSREGMRMIKDFEGIQTGLSGYDMIVVLQKVLSDKIELHEAIQIFRQEMVREIQRKRTPNVLIRAFRKVKLLGQMFVWLYKVFDERCPYIAESRVLR